MFYKKFFCIFLIFLIIINISFASISFSIDDELYVWSNLSSDSIETSQIIDDENFLNLTCASAILIEQNSGEVLYSHNVHEQLRPASVTKVMTILLIMEAIDSGAISLEDSVPCSQKASSMGGSQIWLDTTETLTVNEMLKAICVVSANDCCVAMAEYIAGSEEMFVNQMNARAKELGMNDTCFKNCHGIDEDGHVTSSYDIALMSRELLFNHPEITNYTTIWMDSLRDGKSELVSTNKLVRNYTGCTGLKTGSTSLALFNISASATRDDLSLIAVIMRAETSALRFSEASTLLNYGFSNFSYKNFSHANEVVENIPVEKGVTSNVNAVFAKDAGAIIPANQNSNIEQSLNLPTKITAPISAGQKLGEATFSLNGEIVGTVDIVSESEVKKLSCFNMASYLYRNWFFLLRD